MADLATTEIKTADPATDLDGDLVAAAVGGDTAEIGPGHFLLALNSHAAEPRTVTVDIPGEPDGHAITDAALTIAALDYGIIPLTVLFRGTTGRAVITYSDAAADLTVAVYKLGR
jgi:hypothetical protein